jgi:hypothetical protein
VACRSWDAGTGRKLGKRESFREAQVGKTGLESSANQQGRHRQFHHPRELRDETRVGLLKAALPGANASPVCDTNRLSHLAHSQAGVQARLPQRRAIDPSVCHDPQPYGRHTIIPRLALSNSRTGQRAVLPESSGRTARVSTPRMFGCLPLMTDFDVLTRRKMYQKVRRIISADGYMVLGYLDKKESHEALEFFTEESEFIFRPHALESGA